MEKYFIDTRVVPALVSALNEDIELDMYTGEFLNQARSVSSKLGSISPTGRLDMSPEEWFFLNRYINELVGENT